MPNEPVPPGFKTGLKPRNYLSHPQGCYANAAAFPDSELIDKAEWADRWQEQKQNRASLLDMREDNYEVLKSLDQNGYGLCWAFSSTKAVMYTRAVMNEPGIRLSAWYVAGNVKGWADEGGWGAESLAFIAKYGVPAMEKCPKYSRGSVAADAVESAALHKVLEWWDGTDDPNYNTKIAVSMLLKAVPCVIDLNDMGHSMCGIAIGSLDPLEIVYDNSWGDQGEKGLYRGRGARARPDGIVVPRVSVPSIQ